MNYRIKRPFTLMLLDNEYAPDLRVKREIEALTEAGWSVRLVCWDREARHPEFDSAQPFLEIIRLRTPSERQLGFRQIPNLMSFYRKVFSKRKSFICPDTEIIHCHDLLMLPLGSMLSAWTNAGLVYDAHEIYCLMDSHRYPSSVRFLMDKTESYLGGRADAFITVSEQRVDKWWKRRIPEKRIHISGNWYDPRIIDQEKRNAIRRKIGIGDDVFLTGYIGSLHLNRRVDLLLDAVKHDHSLAAVVAGRGVAEDDIRRIADSNNNIFFLGWLEDPWPVYEAMDAVYYVMDNSHPYSSFNAPNNAHIAASLSLPLITGPGGEAEYIVGKHVSGIVLDSLKTESVKEAIIKIRDSASKIHKDHEKVSISPGPYTASAAGKALLEAYQNARRSRVV